MNLIISQKPYWLLSWFLSMAFSGIAQENDFLKGMIKESIKMDFLLSPNEKMIIDSTSGCIRLDVNKSPLPKLGYNYNQNSLLLSYKDSLKFEPTISPYLTMFYTNQSIDPYAMDTDGQVITNVLLVPLTAIGTLNFNALFDYLIRAGVIPYDDPVLPRETKKEKALRIITKEVYPIDDK